MTKQLLAAAALLIGSNASANETLDFSMGSISGSTYAIGVQVAETVRANGDYNINVKTGGALGNLIMIGRDQAQFGHSSSGLALAAYNGQEPYEQRMENLRGIAKVMESSFQFLTLENVPIDSLAELREKQYPLKIAVGPRGRENELLSRRVLEANGISYDDIRDWGGRVEFISISDANSLIRDGHLEAVTILSGLPYAPVVEINSARQLQMLPLSDETVTTMQEQYGYTATEIKASTYEGIDSPVPSVAGGVVLVTNSNVSAETAYQLTQAVCSDQGRDRLATLSGSISSYLASIEACASGIGIPLHEGAERYFSEAGIVQ